MKLLMVFWVYIQVTTFLFTSFILQLPGLPIVFLFVCVTMWEEWKGVGRAVRGAGGVEPEEKWEANTWRAKRTSTVTMGGR